MRKLTFVTAAAAMLALAGPAFADPAVDHTNNGNDRNKNCFGQARAEAARAGVVGEAASARKGQNAEMNAAFKEACQTEPS